MKDLTESERADFDAAKLAARGLPANIVAHLLLHHVRGVNYYGCGKEHIFRDLVEDNGLDRVHDNSFVGGSEVWTRRETWWPKFLNELRKEPRPPTAKQRRQKKEAEAARERRERQAEAEGWTSTSAQAKLAEVEDQMVPLLAQLQALKEQKATLLRVLDTIDPRWRLR